jgi:hypothetical protein
MSDTTEQRLAALLSVLKPPPAAWVKAAYEIPRTQGELEQPPERVARCSNPTAGEDRALFARHVTRNRPPDE